MVLIETAVVLVLTHHHEVVRTLIQILTEVIVIQGLEVAQQGLLVLLVHQEVVVVHIEVVLVQDQVVVVHVQAVHLQEVALEGEEGNVYSFLKST